MSNDEAIIIAAFIIFLLIVGGIVLIDLYLYNSNLNELQEYLKDINYFKIYHQQFSALFGPTTLYRDLHKSSQLVDNFKHSKKFDYLVKYFGLCINDEAFDHLDTIYNVQRKAEQFVEGNSMKERILDGLTPWFSMTYRSPQGRSSRTSYFEFNSDNILMLQSYIRNILSAQNHAKYQRSAMTTQLRESILRRDNWTCRRCGNSVYKEPNLLLEIDHIIPISKGGKTEPNNLQTLCWKCNRRKSDKIVLPADLENTQKLVFPDDSNLD
jgi:rubrerythrin